LFHATDWAATPLGPPQDWPQSLRTAVSICLNSRFPMFVWWGPSLVNIYNEAYVPMLGQRHPAAFGQPAQGAWQDTWDVLAPQVDTVMQRGESTWNERVLLVIDRNGFPENTYFTWSYSPIHDENGAIGGLFCACTEETSREASERQRNEVVLQAQNTANTLKAWFDSAPGFIALLRGPDFVFEMVNQAYYQLVGHRQIEGLPVFQALPEARNQGFEELLQGVYDTGQPFVGRALPISLQRQPNGPRTEAFIDLSYQPVRDSDGKVVGLFAQGYDVTEQVMAAQSLRQADRRKDEFLATLAHELRNPLAPIRQAAALAKAPATDKARQTWALEVIERQAHHMSLLLNDLLDVSRVSRGHFELRLQRVALADVVNAAIETSRPLIDRKHHALALSLPSEPVMLQADPIRLSQVLSNLVTNAAKYTDDHGHLALTAVIDGDEVVITVRDDGIGLGPHAPRQIFEMFSQVTSAIDRAEGGLGIGLALSRGLVTLHGGSIEARSAGLGKGSEFVVRLPLDESASSDTQPLLPLTAEGGEAKTILIADDNLDGLESLASLLEMFGHTAHRANDGLAALTLAEQTKPDIAILDIGMPGLTGYEVARKIRSMPWGQGIRLIALTGWGQAEDQARSHAAGFDHHVTKPVDLDALQALLQQR
jgi:signal transduction histidine kinase